VSIGRVRVAGPVMPDLDVVLIAGIAALVGAIVQSGVGMGMGLIAAPLIALLDPSLMPVAPLILGATISLLGVGKDARHADLRGLGWAIAGRVAGTVAGVWVVAVVPVRVLSVAVGVMVLLAVGFTTGAVHVPRTPRTLLVAGAIAGVTGTSTSIAGPPVALVYQRESGSRIRGTLAVFFFVGTMMSLAALAVAGHMSGRSAVTGLALVPFVLAGFAVSGPLRRYLDQGRIRAGVLVVAAASAVVLIVRSLA
jgi:uncharacterized protein